MTAPNRKSLIDSIAHERFPLLPRLPTRATRLQAYQEGQP